MTVPANVAPEQVTVELTQFSSMQTAAERVLGEGKFTALGTAYELSMPLKTSTAIDFAVTDSLAAGKKAEELAWLVRTVGLPEVLADNPTLKGRAPLVDYVLMPVTRVDEDGTVHGDLFDRQRFQLVTLAEPLKIQSFTIDSATLSGIQSSTPTIVVPKALALPFFIFVNVVFDEDPIIDWEAYGNAAFDGVAQAYKVLVSKKGFLGPAGTITVVVGKLPKPDIDGFVACGDHQKIHLNYKMDLRTSSST